MIFLKSGQGPAVVQWKAPGTFFGTSSGAGSTSHTLIHNRGSEVSYVEVVQLETGGIRNMVTYYDQVSNLNQTGNSWIWGWRGRNLNLNQFQITLYRQDLLGEPPEVEITLYFFDAS